jgi:hypothetical protein
MATSQLWTIRVPDGPIWQRSAAEQARAAEAMIDEALRNPYGRLAADLRRLGMLPQKET